MCGLLSWTLLVIGVLFIVMSLAGAFLEILKDFRSSLSQAAAQDKALGPEQMTDVLGKVTGLLEAVTKLLTTMIGAPKWFLLLLAGLGIAAYGHWMSASVCG